MATTSLNDVLDELVAGTQRKGPECSIAALLRSLPKETAEKLLLRIDDHEISATRIADALHSGGHPIYVNSLRRHRRRGRAGGCACK